MVKKMSRVAACMSVLLASAFAACNVSSTDETTGGVNDGAGGAGGAGGASANDRCPAGVTVVLSDYLSTQIALSSLQGETRSASFLSTASTSSGLAFALSGDVTVPSAAPASGKIVLLDRYGTNVISWANPKTAQVIAQLEVGTGFESNPQDYLEVDDETAFVTRYGVNADAGKQDFDEGDDVLVLDLSNQKKPEIADRIALPRKNDLPARPGRMLRVGDEIIVPLERLSEDFSTTGDAMLVGISIEDRSVAWTQTLEGLKNCGRPSLSPDGRRLVVACNGSVDENGLPRVDESALVFFKAEKGPLEEIERVSAGDLIGEAVQSRAVYASDQVLLFGTQTAWGGDTNNRLFAYDLKSGEATELLEASPDAQGLGKGLVYVGLACAPGCSDTCLVADADKGVLQRVKVTGNEVELLEPVTVENAVGLPPTGLGHR